MNVTVTRKWYSLESTCGELSLDSSFECFTLEPSQNSGDLVPANTYPAEISETFKPTLRHALAKAGLPPLTPHLIGLPGPIEIHIGNQASDTDGCCLVGQLHPDSGDWIGQSGLAMKSLMMKLPQRFTLTYVNQPEEMSRDPEMGVE